MKTDNNSWNEEIIKLLNKPGIVCIGNEQTKKIYLSKSENVSKTLYRIKSQLENGSFNNKEMVKDYKKGNLVNASIAWNDDFNGTQILAEEYNLWVVNEPSYSLYNRKLVTTELICYMDFTHPKSPSPNHVLVFIGPKALKKTSKITPVGVFKTVGQAHLFKEKYYYDRFFIRKIIDQSIITKEYISWYNEEYG